MLKTSLPGAELRAKLLAGTLCTGRSGRSADPPHTGRDIRTCFRRFINCDHKVRQAFLHMLFCLKCSIACGGYKYKCFLVDGVQKSVEIVCYVLCEY